jgi:hypothetical protein
MSRDGDRRVPRERIKRDAKFESELHFGTISGELFVRHPRCGIPFHSLAITLPAVTLTDFRLAYDHLAVIHQRAVSMFVSMYTVSIPIFIQHLNDLSCDLGRSANAMRTLMGI